jgi:hypothetical protein
MRRGFGSVKSARWALKRVFRTGPTDRKPAKSAFGLWTDVSHGGGDAIGPQHSPPRSVGKAAFEASPAVPAMHLGGPGSIPAVAATANSSCQLSEIRLVRSREHGFLLGEVVRVWCAFYANIFHPFA